VCNYSLAGRYDNAIPSRFLAPIDCLKIPAQVGGSQVQLRTALLFSLFLLNISQKGLNATSTKDFTFFIEMSIMKVGIKLGHCPASPEKEDQRAAGSPAALTQLALCLRFAPDLKGRELATRLCNPQ
jgi:hypothetical protein